MLAGFALLLMSAMLFLLSDAYAEWVVERQRRWRHFSAVEAQRKKEFWRGANRIAALLVAVTGILSLLGLLG